MSSSKHPTRYLTKVYDKLSAFPINNNNNASDQNPSILEPSLPLRLTLFECPSTFVRDFASLFPDVDCFRQKRGFCALLFTFSTTNDMSGWNQAVEEERDRLHRAFLSLADDVASRLVENGSWADFVDPVGGKPHRGAYCNDNLFETDPRLRPFGVQIEDLGCCKCVRLEGLGSKAFVGCLFTDAGFEAPVWRELLA